MTALEVLIGAPALLALVAFAAHARLPLAAMLPMQWGLDGRPTWSAPRAAALGFIPALCALVMTLLAATRVGSAPHGQAVLLFVAAAFVAADALYLTLLARHLAR